MSKSAAAVRALSAASEILFYVSSIINQWNSS
jgi:hypothetical protein